MLQLKMRNLVNFVMREESLEIEEKLEVIKTLNEIRSKLEQLKKGKEVKNVNENIESSNQSNHSTTSSSGTLEESTEKGLKKK